MRTCRLMSRADLEWALQQVDYGHTVLVTLPRPGGPKRAYRACELRTFEFIQIARERAHLSGIRHEQAGRFRAREFISQFHLTPRMQGNPGDPSPVREPRRPTPSAPSVFAEVELPRAG